MSGNTVIDGGASLAGPTASTIASRRRRTRTVWGGYATDEIEMTPELFDAYLELDRAPSTAGAAM